LEKDTRRRGAFSLYQDSNAFALGDIPPLFKDGYQRLNRLCPESSLSNSQEHNTDWLKIYLDTNVSHKTIGQGLSPIHPSLITTGIATMAYLHLTGDEFLSQDQILLLEILYVFLSAP
jgi:hypothetical protein